LSAEALQHVTTPDVPRFLDSLDLLDRKTQFLDIKEFSEIGDICTMTTDLLK